MRAHGHVNAGWLRGETEYLPGWWGVWVGALRCYRREMPPRAAGEEAGWEEAGGSGAGGEGPRVCRCTAGVRHLGACLRVAALCGDETSFQEGEVAGLGGLRGFGVAAV